MRGAIVLEALEAEAQRVHSFLAELAPGDWERPTRCPPLRVHELAAHALRGVVRIKEMFAAGPAAGAPEKDGATYFDYDPAQIGPEVVSRSIATAKDFPVGGFPARWRDEWKSVLDRVAAALESGDPVLKGVFGTIRLSEYLRTRAVEVVVHHMDLRDALELGPSPDHRALDVVCGVLAQRLGTDPRDRGMDPIRFALAGTGRADPTDDERALLGAAAARLPAIA